MNFPKALDFLEKFGIEPLSIDNDMGVETYEIHQDDLTLRISFSDVMCSFQIDLAYKGSPICMISSEATKSIKIVETRETTGLKIEFEFRDVIAESIVIIYPLIEIKWSALIK